MNRLPHGQVDAHHAPSLCHIGVARNGHIEAISAALRRDESASLQKTLQVTKEAWSVEEDVHAASGARELPQPTRLLLLSSETRLRQEVTARSRKLLRSVVAGCPGGASLHRAENRPYDPLMSSAEANTFSALRDLKAGELTRSPPLRSGVVPTASGPP